jgi:hypothetical protein
MRAPCKDSTMRSAFRRAVLAGILAGLAYAIWRKVRARVPPMDPALEWQTAPFPFPPAPRPAAAPQAPPAPGVPRAAATPHAWVAPVNGGCPVSHPVKAKLSSGIFHVPGGQNYDRTKPDRCYLDAAAAEADGLRKSLR